MAADQLGHALMALVAAVLLTAAGAQLWMLRRITEPDGAMTVWRAAAWAQAICGLLLLIFSVVQLGPVSA